MGTDAVDDGFHITLPLQAGSLDRQFVTFQSKGLLAAMFGMTTVGHGEEAQHKPLALGDFLP